MPAGWDGDVARPRHRASRRRSGLRRGLRSRRLIMIDVNQEQAFWRRDPARNRWLRSFQLAPWCGFSQTTPAPLAPSMTPAGAGARGRHRLEAHSTEQGRHHRISRERDAVRLSEREQAGSRLFRQYLQEGRSGTRSQVEHPADRNQVCAGDAAKAVPLAISGIRDIECGTTVNSVARQEQVDFKYAVALAEGRLLVRKSSGIQDLPDLNGKFVALATGTTAERYVLAARDRNKAVTGCAYRMKVSRSLMCASRS
jgi:hypothetical protein